MAASNTAPALAAGAASPAARRPLDRLRRLAGIALTLPALGAIGLSTLLPILHTVWLSLNGPNTALRGTPDFKGLANYGRIIKSLDFQRALWQTLGLGKLGSDGTLDIRLMNGSPAGQHVLELPLKPVGAYAAAWDVAHAQLLIATRNADGAPDFWLARLALERPQ